MSPARTARGGLLLSIAALAGLLVGCGGQGGEVSVTPEPSRFDKPVHIVVDDLEPHREVSVELHSADAKGVGWTSEASFRSNGSGTVDLARTPAVSGSYHGVDAMGLVDTLRPETRGAYYAWGRSPRRFEVTVTAEDGEDEGRTVATGSFTRRGRAPGVRTSDQFVPGAGFRGRFWRPPQRGGPPRPAVLDIGGSEGGLSGDLPGAGFASAGFPTLNVAYFRARGLPPTLKNIPLEYFATALRWLARQPGVRADRIYVSGGSRGSEAALLIGAHYPRLVHGVIASVPGDKAFGSFPGNGKTPAWTYRGRPVPYSRRFSSTEPIIDPSAEIPVRRIRGPVFLDCGTEDQVWTSCPYAGAIQRRLHAAGDRYPHVLYRYRGGGHYVGGLVPYQPGSGASYGQGDTYLANYNAQARLWPHVLDFLRHPDRTGTFTEPTTPPPPR